MITILPPYISWSEEQRCPIDIISICHHCEKCNKETSHYLHFHAYNLKHHAVSYNLECKECFKAKKPEETVKLVPQYTTIDNWIVLLYGSNIYDYDRDN